MYIVQLMLFAMNDQMHVVHAVSSAMNVCVCVHVLQVHTVSCACAGLFLWTNFSSSYSVHSLLEWKM